MTTQDGSIRYGKEQVDGVSIFYREAGSPTAPAILLLHGFPSSSHMFRDLIPRLAPHAHVIAPDLPGFGFSDAPDRSHFAYTFDHLADVIERFTEPSVSAASRSISLTTVLP
jgi:pimeloyl-ACP methyl ester carboxylesterase